MKRFRVSGFRIRVLGFGLQISSFGFRVSGFGIRVSGFRFQVAGFGFRVSGAGISTVGSSLLLSLLRSVSRLIALFSSEYSFGAALLKGAGSPHMSEVPLHPHGGLQPFRQKSTRLHAIELRA